MQVEGGVMEGFLDLLKFSKFFFFKLRGATITILKIWCQPCLHRLELMTISGVDAMLILLCALGVRALGPRWSGESKRS